MSDIASFYQMMALDDSDDSGSDIRSSSNVPKLGPQRKSSATQNQGSNDIQNFFSGLVVDSDSDEQSEKAQIKQQSATEANIQPVKGENQDYSKDHGDQQVDPASALAPVAYDYMLDDSSGDDLNPEQSPQNLADMDLDTRAHETANSDPEELIDDPHYQEILEMQNTTVQNSIEIENKIKMLEEILKLKEAEMAQPDQIVYQAPSSGQEIAGQFVEMDNELIKAMEDQQHQDLNELEAYADGQVYGEEDDNQYGTQIQSEKNQEDDQYQDQVTQPGESQITTQKESDCDMHRDKDRYSWKDKSFSEGSGESIEVEVDEAFNIDVREYNDIVVSAKTERKEDDESHNDQIQGQNSGTETQEDKKEAANMEENIKEALESVPVLNTEEILLIPEDQYLLTTSEMADCLKFEDLGLIQNYQMSKIINSKAENNEGVQQADQKTKKRQKIIKRRKKIQNNAVASVLNYVTASTEHSAAKAEQEESPLPRIEADTKVEETQEAAPTPAEQQSQGISGFSILSKVGGRLLQGGQATTSSMFSSLLRGIEGDD